MMTPDEVFSIGGGATLGSSTHSGLDSTHSGLDSTHSGLDSTHSGLDSTHSGLDSTHSGLDSTHSETAAGGDDLAISNTLRDSDGRLINRYIDRPYIDSIDNLAPSFRDSLLGMAKIPREKQRLGNKTEMKAIILKVCLGHYISVSALGEILNRNPNALRQQYLKPLVDEGRLRLAFPHYKNDPKQGYSTTAE